MNHTTRTVLASLAAPLLASSLDAQQLKVYVLAGQSNMQGHAKVATFGYLADDPATAPLLEKMTDRKGRPQTCDDVWISYLTGGRGGDQEVTGKLTAGFGARRNPQQSDDKIGPEFTFGLTVAEAHDGPVLLIKTAWGGKSLHTDFRSPSAGPYVFSDEQLARFAKQNKDIDEAKAAKEAATGRYYRSMIAHVKRVLDDPKRVCPDYDKSAGYELAGFVWFQGWNDMVDRGTYPNRNKEGGYGQYSDCMAAFIRDVRKDLDTPELPFVIGVMGVGGELEEGARNTAVHRNFRAAMAAPASLREFRGNVTAVQTAPFWDAKLQEISTKLDQVKGMGRKLRTKHKDGPNKDGKMSKADQKLWLADYRAKVVGADNDAIWKRGASNAAYHYLGCAKTMAEIGVAFAEAALAMRER